MNAPAEGAHDRDIMPHEWKRRKEFSGFTDEDVELLRQLRPAAEAFVDDVIEELYRRFLAFEETRTLLSDPATLMRVKTAQRAYFLALTSGDYGEKYLSDRLRVGRAHQKIGLPPVWYMGAYSLYVQLVFPRVMEAVRPVDKAQRTFSALLKLISLDTEIAISTYIGAREEVISRQAGELVDAQQSLHESERFAVLGEMAGMVAHELSQPLQVINIACAAANDELANADAHSAAPDSAYIRSRLDRVAQQIETASHILRDLRSFVRGVVDDQPRPFDPAVALQGAIRLTEYGVRLARGRLSMQLGERLPLVAGSIGRFEQALVSLINHVRDFGSPTIEIAGEALSRDGGDFVRVMVDASTPVGIPADLASELSLSSVHNEPRSMGRGLGLRICRRVIEEMGGKVSVSIQPANGIQVEILLRVADAPAGRR